jgi:response regulator RpfG family c-di-GMP phosphodiesterase
VLAVDDEPANVQLIGRMLRASYEVVSCTSAEEAMELLRTEPVDMLLTDQSMGERNGAELIREALALDECLECCVITAFPDHEALTELRKQGLIRRILEKPINRQKLSLCVESGVRNTRLRRSVRDLRGASDRPRE